MRFPSLLIAVAFALSGVANATDNRDESQAIREIERLGGKVERDEKLPGRPVTAVRSESPVDSRTWTFRCSRPSQT